MHKINKKLTNHEKLCLQTLKEICFKYEMDDYYSICELCEHRVCILKRKSEWEVFILERGIEFSRTTYKDCIEACIEVIRQCSYSKDEFKDALIDFKNIYKKNKKIKILAKIM